MYVYQHAVMLPPSFPQYADWIDIEGNARTYLYSDIAFKAVFLGVANATQATQILQRYDSVLAGLLEQFNVSADDVWAAPCNVVPITNPLDVVAHASQSLPFGACCSRVL